MIIDSYRNTRPEDTANDTIITDKDTGETIDLSPSDTPETDLGPNPVGLDDVGGGLPIFGYLELVEKILANDKDGIYTNSIRPGFNNFTSSRLGDKYESITVIPYDTIIESSGTIKVSIRLGQTDETLPVTITPTESGESMIFKVSDSENKHGGPFVFMPNLVGTSTQYSITYDQTYKNANDPIRIQIEASEGYREAALNHMRELGFNLDDFIITFNNYENPFK